MSAGLPLSVLLLMAAGVLSAQAATNPFAAASTLPFEAPAFNVIKDTDYQPALEEGMRQQLREVAAIADNPAPPTFDNTVVALEKSGQMLSRTSMVFHAMLGSNTNPVLERVQRLEEPKLADEEDAIELNPRLFARIKTLYDQRAGLRLDPESLQLLTITYRDMVHAGANLSVSDKAEVAKLDNDLAKLTTSFEQKLLAATKAAAYVTDDKSRLAGLSDIELGAAAQAAEARGLKGKWLIPLEHATQQPLLADLSDRGTREALYHARWTATEKSDANDTRADVASIAKLRARKAKLLGYPNFAAYALYDSMAQTPAAAQNFMAQLVTPVAAKAAEESKLIQAAIDRDGAHFTLQPWDWARYAAQVQKERYHLDAAELKPYFELHTVLEKGVFFAAHELYGISFKRRTDIPVYQPDVMVYEVQDQDGKPLTLLYLDYFKRDNKGGGAWMDIFVQQSRLLGTRPVIFNVLNISKPAPGQPALLDFDEVTAMFHEFGHALHGMFANQEYPSLSGTSVARDFVEFPSQFNEHWALYPTVLHHYARHYKTGQVIPEELVQRLRQAHTWGLGYQRGEEVAAAELDMSWHVLGPTVPKQNVDAFDMRALKDTHTDFANVPTRYRSSYFEHIWGGGYAASYYAYLWTVMLDDDAFAWFTDHGGLTRANGQRFRDLILSRGHTEDYSVMFRSFYGKDPDIGPMLRDDGLTR
ncbi:MAG TPA: M3 family metallopeptidase [Steroidobacteraceae bacterium]|nr:M3 family metallopeptidase [Steroidobacteraceae bacterium]